MVGCPPPPTWDGPGPSMPQAPRSWGRLGGMTGFALGECARALAGKKQMSDALEYQSHRLAVIEQPGGGFLVEITPPAGGQAIRTVTYQSRQQAIAEAKANIDKHPQARR